MVVIQKLITINT
ncbi:hypothetical protein FWK35_00030441 [Aphis craccivora]|nr:hypothetical protein FWK35_00019556 [Aphis craccivora]KAF0757398.1 hypothetical protein FWK35_00026111 [Aphis craccivora]KAF0758021.1 hypothetical protein FWK35_00036583 [Aphis craccivora]KAF0762043.1 hypothetical protein FWK35_00016731 [Aphis craccivora]KAF0767507.1 hypothetical protein FWK35_00012618 [Aphis craccivora]